MSASLPSLLGLWRGDEDSIGYIHEGLAREICILFRPSSFDLLVQQLYPGADANVLQENADGVDVARAAFGWYEDEKKRMYQRSLRRSRRKAA